MPGPQPQADEDADGGMDGGNPSAEAPSGRRGRSNRGPGGARKAAGRDRAGGFAERRPAKSARRPRGCGRQAESWASVAVLLRKLLGGVHTQLLYLNAVSLLTRQMMQYSLA